MGPGEEQAARARLTDAIRRHEAYAAELARRHRDLARAAAEAWAEGKAGPVIVPDVPVAPLSIDANALPAGALAAALAQVESATHELEVYAAVLANMATPDAAANATLGPAPRPVPFAYAFAELSSLGILIVLFVWLMIATPLAGSLHGASAVFEIVVFFGPPAAILAWSVARARGRVALLARGDLPVSHTVTTRAGLGSYTHARITQARGFSTFTVDYSGPKVVSTVHFVTKDGAAGELSVSGLAYDGGAILCRSVGGGRAVGRIVSDFTSRPEPDERGAWRTSSVHGLIMSAIFVVLFVAAAAIGVSHMVSTLAAQAPGHPAHPQHRHH